MAVGHTTASHWPVVSKYAFRPGIRQEHPGIPDALVFDRLLLVDHYLSGPCHSATNEPSANVYLGGEITLYTIHLSLFLIAFVLTYIGTCYFVPGWRIKLEADHLTYFLESLKKLVLIKFLVSLVAGLIIGLDKVR